MVAEITGGKPLPDEVLDQNAEIIEGSFELVGETVDGSFDLVDETTDVAFGFGGDALGGALELADVAIDAEGNVIATGFFGDVAVFDGDTLTSAGAAGRGPMPRSRRTRPGTLSTTSSGWMSRSSGAAPGSVTSTRRSTG